MVYKKFLPHSPIVLRRESAHVLPIRHTQPKHTSKVSEKVRLLAFSEISMNCSRTAKNCFGRRLQLNAGSNTDTMAKKTIRASIYFLPLPTLRRCYLSPSFVGLGFKGSTIFQNAFKTPPDFVRRCLSPLQKI